MEVSKENNAIHKVLKTSPIYSGGREEFRRVFAIFEINKQEYSQKTQEKYQKILDKWWKKIEEKEEKATNETPSVSRSSTLITETHKQCYTCRQILPHSEFHKIRQNKHGLSSSCKECIKLYQAKKRQNFIS